MRAAVVLALLISAPALGQKPAEPTPTERVAKEGGKIGDIIIHVRGVEEGGHLVLTVELLAASKDKRVVYRSWNREGSAWVRYDDGTNLPLVDKRKVPDNSTVLATDKPTADVLRFKGPDPKVGEVELELTGENVGLDRKITHFLVILERGKEPGTWVRYRRKPLPGDKPKP